MLLSVALLVLTSTAIPCGAEPGIDATWLRPSEGKVVSAIELAGNTAPRPHVILRELQTAVGNPMVLSTLEADLQRLHNSDIFGSIGVDVATSTADSNATVRLTIRVREIPHSVPHISYDVSDQDG